MTTAPLPRFLQIHTLHAYPAALLNRDEAGSHKRIDFGGATRLRISSQCLKRHWRESFSDHGLGAKVGPNSVRSKHNFEQFLVLPLTEKGVDLEVARSVAQTLLEETLGSSAEKKGKKASAEVTSDQVVALGRGEMTILLGIANKAVIGAKTPKEAAEAAKDLLTPDRKKELKNRGKAAGIDTCLFGRMVLGDVLAAYDAPVHVAHAMSVSGEAIENDFFTAVDDLAEEANVDRGGHLGTTELGAGIFYGHVAVDLPLLVANITGSSPAAWHQQNPADILDILDTLVHAIVTVSPGAKLGSTAPYTYASATILELTAATPRTLATAFINPVPRKGDPLLEAGLRLAKHAVATDAFLGSIPIHRRALLDAGLASLGAPTGPLQGATCASLPALATWLKETLADKAFVATKAG